MRILSVGNCEPVPFLGSGKSRLRWSEGFGFFSCSMTKPDVTPARAGGERVQPLHWDAQAVSLERIYRGWLDEWQRSGR
jgi:hypothetical protein